MAIAQPPGGELLPLYWPRMSATVILPSAGRASARKAQEDNAKVYPFYIRPHRARLVSNSHNEADELQLTFAYDECGLDPRFLRSAEIYFYLTDAYADGGFTPSLRNCRFLGIAREVERSGSASGAKLIEIHAQDYTCLFLEMKNYPPQGLPDYSQTLLQAWQRICDFTGYWDLTTDPPRIDSSVTRLRDHLEFKGDIDPNLTVGSAVPERLRKLGKPDMDHTTDSWGVWQRIVEHLGLISFIRGDRCVVTTATDYYTGDNPPHFVYGKNILEFKESRRLGDITAKNVCVRSYDPLKGVVLESLYPDPEYAMKPKKLGATATKHPPKTTKSEDYELFDLEGPLTQDTLDVRAQRIWEERTRQELKGSLKTAEMRAATVYGGRDPFNLLELQAGDCIQVEIDRGALDDIQKTKDPTVREQKLIERGYLQETANFIAENLEDVSKLPAQFMVHSVETELEATGAEGGCSYSMSIDYVNRIDISATGAALGAGDATNQAKGKRTPLLSVTGTKDKSRAVR